MKNRLEVFLEDMTYNTRFNFLEEGKDKTELQEIAEKRGIILPAHDLAPFKGRYAFVDRMNRNNCTLPKEEVEKSLDSLIGKAIDFDHFRKNVVGHWIDAKIEDDEIIAYGVFYKGNFNEEYQLIKKMMEEDVLAISFEAWGNREERADGSYNLTSIEFAGGALLIKSEPAFPGSEVLEMSNKGKILEFAKTMIAPNEFIHESISGTGNRGKVIFPADSPKINDNKEHFPINDINQARNALLRASKYDTTPKWYSGTLSEVVSKVKEVVKKEYPILEVSSDEEKIIEESRFYLYDMEGIMRAIAQVDCLSCKETGFSDISNIDFEQNKAKIKCINCDADMSIDLTPVAKLSKKGRKIKKIAEIKSSAPNQSELEIKDNGAKKNAKEEKNQMKKLLEKYQKSSVAEVIQEVAKVSISRELTAEEIELAYTVLEYVNKNGGQSSLLETRSLMSLKGEPKANPTSLMSATVEEEVLKAIVEKIAKGEDEKKEEKPVEEPKSEEKPVEEPKSEEKPVEEAKEKDELSKALETIKVLQAELAKINAEKIAQVVKARKDELGDKAKDISDEDILDDNIFKIAQLEKENDDLKAGTFAKVINVMDLTKGSAEKGETFEATKRSSIRTMAFGTENIEDE